MKTQFKLGKTYGVKDNDKTRELQINGEYLVVIQEKSESKNFIIQTINSRKVYIEKTTQINGNPFDYYDEVQIRAMDILQDEICIKDNTTGTIIYGDAKMYIGENKIIEFTTIENDLIANVQYEIETVSGERLTGFLYCTHQPKNYYLENVKMKTQFKLGQVVRFKNYKRNEDEKEAYFIVIQEEDNFNQLVLNTINTNRIYTTGTTIVPEFPDEDLLVVELRPYHLIDQEITIKETIFNDVVTGKCCFFNSDNYTIQFTQRGNTLVSDAEFEFYSNIKYKLMGPLCIRMDYKNNNQK